MKIHIFDNQKALNIPKIPTRQIIKRVIADEGQTCDEVSVHFVTTKEICCLHEEYFDDPSTTDCISFPLDDAREKYRVLGEIFVCPETAKEYSFKHQVDPYEEVTLYLVHGLLHLMGYDDIRDKDRRAMRSAERRHMSKLKEMNLVLKKRARS